ncbi:MAG: phosphate propanoyltransferase [Oscillospiraceae bacterium]|nr:phosphate propanoyltransferase [Oscillospiraceae bacterium]
MAKVLIETSARHAHVSQEDLQALFGETELTVKKMLSQPGEFASAQRVTVIGPKKELENVLILGPCRKATQVEISATDARSIGVETALRESGDLEGTPGCVLRGPKGEVTLKEGVIVAKRHIHMNPDFAKANNLENKQIVSLKMEGNGRSALLGDVVCRVHPNFSEAAHIDTDEANAVFATPGGFGEIVS